jgi:phage replication O-like protein O
MSQEFEGFPPIDYRGNEGFTRVPNVFFEIQAKLAPAEQIVLLHIIRQTYGWHKGADFIALSQFQGATGLSKPAILRAIKALEEAGYVEILRGRRGSRETSRYCVRFAKGNE